MVDLSTTYLGLTLKNPLVVSASPLCEKIDNIRRMEDAGASAVVLPSLFEEQITLESHHLDRYLSHGTESFAESLTYFPDMIDYNLGPDGYLEHIRRAKFVVDIPIIGSLNGSSTGGWISYAKKIEEAGADALELNTYYIPTDPELTGAQVEQMYLDLVRDVKASIKIPVAVKLNAYFSAVPNMAKRLDQAGADALVLFNRFYQPDFDLENLEVVPNLILSGSYELLVRSQLGGDSVRPHPSRPGRHGRRSHGSRRAEGDDGRSAGGDDDISSSAERHRAPDDGARRPAGLDGGTRV